LRRAEGGAKIFGVFRVKNHDFTPKNHIFSICGGRREKFWGISCEKITILHQKIIFFPIFRGRAPGAPPLITIMHGTYNTGPLQGRIQDFKLGGGALKKIAPSRGRHEIFGVFRVKNHDFTPKNHIFFNCRGRREHF
jgi:hypothetical protein